MNNPDENLPPPRKVKIRWLVYPHDPGIKGPWFRTIHIPDVNSLDPKPGGPDGADNNCQHEP